MTTVYGPSPTYAELWEKALREDKFNILCLALAQILPYGDELRERERSRSRICKQVLNQKVECDELH
jgi:hypothetical protein